MFNLLYLGQKGVGWLFSFLPPDRKRNSYALHHLMLYDKVPPSGILFVDKATLAFKIEVFYTSH